MLSSSFAWGSAASFFGTDGYKHTYIQSDLLCFCSWNLHPPLPHWISFEFEGRASILNCCIWNCIEKRFNAICWFLFSVLYTCKRELYFTLCIMIFKISLMKILSLMRTESGSKSSIYLPQGLQFASHFGIELNNLDDFRTVVEPVTVMSWSIRSGWCHRDFWKKWTYPVKRLLIVHPLSKKFCHYKWEPRLNGFRKMPGND